MSASERIVLVAPNAGEGMGGEAIKALQYFRHLLEAGTDVTLVAHARSRPRLGDLAVSPRVIFVEDGPLQRLLWRSRALAGLLDAVFHLAARRLIARRFDPGTCLIHYLCPISPVEPRFPPRGFAFVLGPLNGAVGYPPAFRDAEGRRAPMERALAGLAQRLSALLLGEKRRARAVLVSGGARTEASVRLAGARPERIRHVVDLGISERFFSELVRFLGWRLNDDAFAAMARDCRGLVFPTLAEANGIVTQEAMAVGLPVIALRWAGPAAPTGGDAAVFVEPVGREAVIAALARDSERADRLAAGAQEVAERDSRWPAAADSWLREVDLSPLNWIARS